MDDKHCFESTIQWHDLLDNPDDLPIFPIPARYIVMIGDQEGYVFGDALYIPKHKVWRVDTCIEEYSMDDFCNHPESCMAHWIEPATPVVMWANYPNDIVYEKFAKNATV